jgi:hypothetical protein
MFGDSHQVTSGCGFSKAKQTARVCASTARDQQEEPSSDSGVPAQPCAHVPAHALHPGLSAQPLHAGNTNFSILSNSVKNQKVFSGVWNVPSTSGKYFPPPPSHTHSLPQSGVCVWGGGVGGRRTPQPDPLPQSTAIPNVTFVTVSRRDIGFVNKECSVKLTVTRHE